MRQVNMTISLAFLAPSLVQAAVDGHLPRGIGAERLRDPPTELSRLESRNCHREEGRNSHSERGPGNGIFQCGDRAPKIGSELAKADRDRDPELSDRNPRRNGLFGVVLETPGLQGLGFEPGPR
jgi:hypothetical protein